MLETPYKNAKETSPHIKHHHINNDASYKSSNIKLFIIRNNNLLVWVHSLALISYDYIVGDDQE